MRSHASEIEGYLESPAAWHPVGDNLVIAGWAFGRTANVREITVSINDGPPQPLGFGLVRADVARRYPGHGNQRSGFAGNIDLPAPVASRLVVKMFATLDDGRRVQWCERGVRLFGDGWRARVGRVGTVIANALREALRTQRLPGPPTQWPGVLLQHWRGVGHGGPPRDASAAAFDGERFAASCRAFFGVGPEERLAPLPSDSATVVLIADRSFQPEAWPAHFASAGAEHEVWIVSTSSDAEAELPAHDGNRVRHVPLAALQDGRGFWLPPGSAERVVLLDGSCLPTSDGPSRAIRASLASGVDWLYTDDVLLGGPPEVDPYFKGAFSPELALVDDYATRLAVVRRDAIVRVGGLRADAGCAQIYDLLLRVSAAGASIGHCPEVCCQRIAPVPAVPDADHRAAAERALNAEGAAGAAIEVRARPSAPGLALPYVKWSSGVADAGGLTIVIPTRDRVPLLQRCVESLRRTVDPAGVTLLIVDDRSSEADTRDYLDRLEHEGVFRCVVLRPSADDRRFNYARLMNAAADVVQTPLMLHLNNDVEALEPGWLDQMAGWLLRPGVGVVGAKLLYADHSIQHAGVLVSSWHGIPEHVFRRLAGGDAGYQRWPHRPRNVSAVTGACLLTRTALYRDLGGFDAEHLAVQFNDVDYCLKTIAAGFRVVVEPAAVLRHDESASRGRTFDRRENAWFIEAHRDYRDLFASPHFDHDSLCGPTPVVTSPERTR